MRALLVSIALVSGIPWGAYVAYELYQHKLEQDSRYTLKALVCKCLTPLSLPHVLFSEYLGLSVDRPINLYKVPLKKGEKSLMELHVFKKVSLKRIPPSTLMIEYELKKPLFLLSGLSNTAIDQEGYVFPYYPFFSPKKLPELKVDKSVKWGDKLDMTQVIAILEKVKELKYPLKLIDLTHAKSDSLGEREIVLKLGKAFVRISPDHLEALTLLSDVTLGQEIVEARIPNQLIIKPLE